jgi:GWxTD domain-containing protein
MKQLLLFLSISLGFGLQAKPKVFFNYKIYYTPDKAAYVSTMLQFSAGTLHYFESEGGLKSSIEITQLFRMNDSIVLVDKYVLDSPLMKDSTVEDFYDIQNYGLAPGVYNYELVVKDLNTGEQITGAQSLRIGIFKDDQVMFSDAQFIESANKSSEKNNFVRHGFFLLPYMTNYFPPDIDKIAFYLEVYNSDKVLGTDQSFLLTYGVQNYQTGENFEEIFQFQRLKSAEVIPVIGYLPIDKVPSGDFNIVINIVNSSNDTVVSKEVFFQRRSDNLNELTTLANVEIDDRWLKSIPNDSIAYYLGSIMPISQRFEYEHIRQLLKTNDTLTMQKYFYAFWKKTSPMDAAREWQKYKQQVYKCEQLFGTQIKSAFETDRGRIWLKYGAPDQFIDRPNEPSAYPYQIWHYYRIGPRSDIRFVFYNPDLVTNDYPMLHSDMQGELQNYRWQNELHKRDSPNYNLDDPGGSAQFGGNSNLYYNEIDR